MYFKDGTSSKLKTVINRSVLINARLYHSDVLTSHESEEVSVYYQRSDNAYVSIVSNSGIYICFARLIKSTLVERVKHFINEQRFIVTRDALARTASATNTCDIAENSNRRTIEKLMESNKRYRKVIIELEEKLAAIEKVKRDCLLPSFHKDFDERVNRYLNKGEL